LGELWLRDSLFCLVLRVAFKFDEILFYSVFRLLFQVNFSKFAEKSMLKNYAGTFTGAKTDQNSRSSFKAKFHRQI